MHRHPHFDLLLHDTDALETALGETVVARESLHQWPLSSVEALTTLSGARCVYKVQREPTVEAEFLARARSPLLPECRVLERTAEQAALLLPFLEMPCLTERKCTEAEWVDCGKDLVRRIGQIASVDRAPLPVYRDLGAPDSWRAFADETIGMLAALSASGTFPEVTDDDLALLRAWADSPEVRECVAETSQLVHGDLKAEHVFLAPDGGLRVIDWQRPCRAPGDVDLVTFLESVGVDPAPHVVPPALGMHGFLFAHWAAEAKTRLLPNLPFFGAWARAGIDRVRASTG